MAEFDEKPIEQVPESTELIPIDSLNKESQDLIKQIIYERDPEKTKDLTYLFNVNQNKKTMVRQNKLNDLLDTVVDQAMARFTAHPEEIDNAQLVTTLKTVQDMIEKGQKQVNGIQEAPLIQINQQSNDINIGDDASSVTRESRERIKNAVTGILNAIASGQAAAAPIVEINSDEEKKK